VAGWWFFPGASDSSTSKPDHDITEILLKVALNTITLTLLNEKHDMFYIVLLL